MSKLYSLVVEAKNKIMEFDCSPNMGDLRNIFIPEQLSVHEDINKFKVMFAIMYLGYRPAYIDEYGYPQEERFMMPATSDVIAFMKSRYFKHNLRKAINYI